MTRNVQCESLADGNVRIAVGLLIRAEDVLNFAAWPFDMSDLEAAKHSCDLPVRDHITVNVDYQLHGVGGDDSWGALTHPEYTLPGDRPYRLAFTLSPLVRLAAPSPRGRESQETTEGTENTEKE